MANIVVDDTFNVTQPEVEKTDKVVNTFMNGWYKRLLSNDNYLNNQTKSLSTKITNTDSKVSIGNTTIYVSASGDDSGAGTQASPYKTIKKALSVAPVTSNGICTINLITAGTYDGINVIGSSVIINASVSNIAFPSIVVSSHGDLAIRGQPITVYSSENATRISVYDNACLIIEPDITVTSVSSSTSQSSTAIVAGNNSCITLGKCTVNDCTGIIVSAGYCCDIHMQSILGTGNTGTVFSSYGGKVSYGACTLTGYKTLVSTSNGGVVLSNKLNTASQELIGAINEVKTTADNNTSLIKKSQTKIQLTVPASSWSLEDNVYYASVLCSSVTSASMTGSFGILCSSIDTSSLTDKKTYLKQAGYIYSAEITTVGYVGFKAVKQPTLDIKVWITLEG